MKVLTKKVTIENKDYVLIQDEQDEKVYYGTIPYSELDSQGRLKRRLNGMEMCINFESVERAINDRKTQNVLHNFVEENKLDINNPEDFKKYAEFCRAYFNM